jgi:hypothetical protein
MQIPTYGVATTGTPTTFTAAEWAGVFIGAVACTALIATFTLRTMRATRPHWIVKRLHKTGEPVTLKLSMWSSVQGGFWDPGYTGPQPAFHQIYEAGTGTYTMDDAGAVHLHLVQRNGHVRDRSGPVPDLAQPSEAHRRARKLTRLALGAYAIFLGLGAVIGAVLAGGSADHRLIGGLIGGVLGYLTGWVLLLTATVGKSASTVVKDARGGDRPSAVP